MKSLGAVILLIGVGMLAFAAFTGIRSNTILAIGLATIIIGFLAHIYLNKKFE
ncbi:MAG: hypothetical protein LBF05_03245 [Tannerella sp.]|nr:hypothetical protein [Tannerella sp.]